jgi:hypothetical protein
MGLALAVVGRTLYSILFMKKFWNLAILVLAATLVFQLYQAGKLDNIRASVISLMMPANKNLGPVETSTKVVPAAPVFAADSESTQAEPATTPFIVSTPEPAQPVAAASTPSEEVASPAATPVATPTPEKPVDISMLDRRFWPRTVTLKKAMNFYITNKGQLVGQIAAPAGAVVKLVEISGIQLKLAMPTGSDPLLVDAADTDIQERAREIVKAVGPAAMEQPRAIGSTPASATPASTTPAPTPWVPRLNERPRNPFQKH